MIQPLLFFCHEWHRIVPRFRVMHAHARQNSAEVAVVCFPRVHNVPRDWFYRRPFAALVAEHEQSFARTRVSPFISRFSAGWNRDLDRLEEFLGSPSSLIVLYV